MATLKRTVTNLTANTLTLRLPGFDPFNTVVLTPSVSTDLLDSMSLDTLRALQPTLNIMVANGSLQVDATADSTAIGEDDTLHTSGTQTVDGTIIARNDNATSLRVRGPQHASEGTAEVQSYSGIFYNDGYDTLGTLKTRASFGANLEMDLAIQSPHALMLLATDGTQTDGKLVATSTTDFVFHARADVETESPKQLIIDRVDTGSTGLSNTSDVNLRTNTGSLYINSGVTTGALVVPVLTSTERDALTPVAGMVIFNSTTSKHQGHDGSIWNDLY